MNKLPRINTWSLLSNGIEGPLAAGFRKAVKYLDLDVSDQTIAAICDKQHDYLMDWFADTFFFESPWPDDEDDDVGPGGTDE